MGKTTHGKTHSPTYISWLSMKARCGNPNSDCYKYYGEQGITVCERWKTFENFYADMGERPEGRSLDRIDNTRGYCPENCKWSTRQEQNKNRRNKRLITAFGKTMNLTEWSSHAGIKIAIIWARLNRGWTAERALTPPQINRKEVRNVSLRTPAKNDSKL